MNSFLCFLGQASTSTCLFFPSVCPPVCPLRIMSQKSYMMWDNNFWCICVKYLWDFFSFFQNLYSLGCYGGKSSNNSPKWKKKFHLSCAIFQEQYSIWSWFLVHLCKMMISPHDIFIFSKFWFSCLLGG